MTIAFSRVSGRRESLVLLVSYLLLTALNIRPSVAEKDNELAREFIRKLVGKEKYQQMHQPRNRFLESPEELGVENTHEGEYGRQTYEDILWERPDELVIEDSHSIYDSHQWDQAPVILEEFKLMFFTQRKIASKQWKRLFRRMMGYDDYLTADPSDIHTNGLRYLYEYSIEEALLMMTSDEWTRAIWVRDPKERALSAYLDQGIENDGAYMQSRCCPNEGRCAETASTFEGFLKVASVCQNPVWIPQSWRMEGRYWCFLTFIGQLEDSARQSEELLRSLDAWERFGETGWGDFGNDPVFPEGYITYAWQNWSGYYFGDGETERLVETMYNEDYENPFMPYARYDDEFMEPAAEDVMGEAEEEADLVAPENDPEEEDPSLDEEEEEGDIEFEDVGVENVETCGAKIYEEIPDNRNPKSLLHKSFYVYKKGHWDGAPIVMEDARLIFFSVPEIASTTFKQLFRRMMGFEDWKESNGSLPHNPHENGLKYLYDYDLDEAHDMLVSDDWKRAIFVRDPKERILDNYMVRVLGNEAEFIRKKCCADNGVCREKAMESFLGFMKVAEQCCNSHWMPQTWRMEGRFFRFLDFVGHVENAVQDSQRLLEQLGIWEEYGATGWGEEGDEAMFGDAHMQSMAQVASVLKEYYDDETEAKAEEMFREDYENPVLGLRNFKVMRDDEGEDNSRRLALEQRDPFRPAAGKRDLEAVKDFVKSLVSEEQYDKMLAKTTARK